MKNEIYNKLAERQIEAFKEACEKREHDKKLRILTMMEKLAVLQFEGRALRTDIYDL